MIIRHPVVIANEIRLKRSQHEGVFLIVEGRDDRLFHEKFVDLDICNITVADGKEKVCEVIDILEKDKFPGVLGIVDSDFDRIESSDIKSPNIIFSDFHDLETMLINSNALDGVLVEYGSKKKSQASNKIFAKQYCPLLYQ